VKSDSSYFRLWPRWLTFKVDADWFEVAALDRDARRLAAQRLAPVCAAQARDSDFPWAVPFNVASMG